MKVFLSPSNQPNNHCSTGDTEKQHCELLVQKMIPLLSQKGIQSKQRNTGRNLSGTVNEANAWGADLYVPIHTNAAGGTVRGTRFGFYPGRTDSSKACTIFKQNWIKLYPTPGAVRTGTYEFLEAKSPKCPSVYCEVVFHDHLVDAQWFHANIDAIAINLVESIEAAIKAQIPIIPTEPVEPKEEVVMDFTGHNARINTTHDAGLSLWSNTNRDKALIAVKKGETVRIIADHNPTYSQGWATAEYKGVQGFVDKQYLVDLGAYAPIPTEQNDMSAYAAELLQISSRLTIIAQELVK